MRRDAVLIFLMHLACANLELDKLFIRADHRSMQAAVRVRLRHRDIILDAAGQRRPRLVDQAEHRVTFGNRLDDNAHRDEVVNFCEVHAVPQ